MYILTSSKHITKLSSKKCLVWNVSHFNYYLLILDKQLKKQSHIIINYKYCKNISWQPSRNVLESYCRWQNRYLQASKTNTSISGWRMCAIRIFSPLCHNGFWYWLSVTHQYYLKQHFGRRGWFQVSVVGRS